jgi:tetratricopeptide (TPR) repeat protein
MRQAKAALEDREYVRAADLYESVLRETGPEFAPPRIGYALSQIALGEDERALSAVLEGLAFHPEQAQLLELLGDLRDRREQVEDALRAWREAFRQAPGDRLRQKILRAERELHAGRDYAFGTSAHFTVRYDGTVDPSVASTIIDYLEERYWTMVEELDHAPRQPITVVLYPTREFRDVTQAAEWVGGLYDGKIRVPLGGLARVGDPARAVLSHELTHAFVHAKTRGNCPRWLHEGLAQRTEGRHLTAAARDELARALEGAEPAACGPAHFSYAMALSLTSYLEDRRGFGALVRVLERLGEGATPDIALESEFGEGYGALCRRWAGHVLQERSEEAGR